MWENLISLIDKLPDIIEDILIAILILVLGYFLLNLTKKYLFKELRKLLTQNDHTLTVILIDLFNKYFLPITYFGLCYLTVKEIKLNATIVTWTKTLSIIATTFCVSQLLVDLSRLLIAFYSKKYRLANKNQDLETKINALFPALRIFIWSLATIFILSNLGFDLGAIIAGLGIGGAAIALASQGILQDLFSYFAILFDRPFELYDLVSVGDFMGYVEHIGIKTTRIKSLTGEQLILANADLTNSRLRNFKRMQRRQVIMKIGVIYETNDELLEEIPDIVKNALKEIGNVSLDIVYFADYGDFSLDFEVIFYVHSNDLRDYRLARHRVNLAIKRAFTKYQLEFAYPTQINYLSQTNNNN